MRRVLLVLGMVLAVGLVAAGCKKEEPVPLPEPESAVEAATEAAEEAVEEAEEETTKALKGLTE